MDLEDWDSGEVITMVLDPEKGCVEQAEALYRKARKQERAAAQLLPLLDAAQEQVRTCHATRCASCQHHRGRCSRSCVVQMSYLDSVAVALDHLEEPDVAALQDIRVRVRQQQRMSSDGCVS